MSQVRSSVAELDRMRLWHPFTQQSEWERDDPLVIAAGEGSWLIDENGRRYLDGNASLWVNVHGHRRPEIDAAVREQLDRIAHTTFLGLTNPPAVAFADALLETAPPGLTRAFLSESGSSACEVAIKLALRYAQLRGETRRTRIVGLRNGYHGDTLGAVSAGGIDAFHAAFAPLARAGPARAQPDRRPGRRRARRAARGAGRRGLRGHRRAADPGGGGHPGGARGLAGAGARALRRRPAAC